MSKISTYPSADVPLQLSDRLIGTEAIRPVPSPTPLATKNFSLGELLQLFSSNFPAASLQAVLDTGNTATQNITLIGAIDATLIKPDNIEDTSGSQGVTFQFLSKGTSSINWVDLPISNLQSVLDAGNTATQDIALIGNITTTKIIPGNIQDDTLGIGMVGQFLSKSASGIKWVNSPIATTPGLADVLFVGNTAINDITLIGNYYGDNFYTNTGGFGLMDDGTLLGQTFQFVNSFGSYLYTSSSGLNTWELPNQSGIIALTSDITPSPLTTKGDLYTFNSGNTRLPIGLNSQVLTVDTSTSTGLKWSAPSTPTPLGYYGAFQDLLTQTLAVANVGQPFLIRTVDEANQVSITANGSGQLTRITPANTGVYNIQWSGQFQNTDNQIHDVNIWFRRGLVSSSGPGTDISGSNGVVALPARKSATAGDQGHVVTGWNFLLSIAAGEYVEFYWMSNSTQITLQAYAAGNPPPSTASLIVTVTQQSGIMAGTGITAINSSTGAAQTLTIGTTGTDFAIVDSGVDHKFNLPVASAINTGKLSSSDWTTFNNKQDALGYIPPRTWKSGANGATVANTITITPTYTQVIPLNTIAAGDVLYLSYRAYAPTAKTTVSSLYIYLNTTNDLTGTPLRIGIYTSGTGTRTIQMERTLSVKGTQTRYFNPLASAPTDNTISAAMTLSTIDWTINQYIVFAIEHTTADQTLIGDFYKIEKA